MAIKNFKHEENQKVWDQFYDSILSNHKTRKENGKSDVENAKMSANQYKPALLQLEEVTGKPFSDVTVNNMNNLSVLRNGRNMNHITGFYITAINNGWLKVNTEMILYLVPKEYRQLVQNLIA